MWVGASSYLILQDMLKYDKYLLPSNNILAAQRVRDGNYYSLVEKINISKTSKEDFFIDGKYEVSDSKYTFIPTVKNKKTGEVISKKRIVEDDIWSAYDSMTIFLRHAVGVSPDQIKESLILPAIVVSSKNLSALEFYLKAVTGLGNYGYHLEKAIELDSTYAFASSMLAQNLHLYQKGSLESKLAIDRAMRHRKKLPYSDQIIIMATKHTIYGEWDKAVKLLKLQLEINPSDDLLQNALLEIYFKTRQIDVLTSLSYKIHDRDPSLVSKFKIMRAEMLNGGFNKVIEFGEQVLKVDPQNIEAIEYIARAFYHTNDYDKAIDYYNRAILINPDLEKNIIKSIEVIESIKNNPVSYDEIKRFEGDFRFHTREMIISNFLLNDQIYTKAQNQWGHYIYPITENKLQAGFSDKAFRYDLLIDSLENVYGYIHTESYADGREYSFIGFKQDSIVWKAEDLLRIGSYDQALVNYEKALMKFPLQYYLHFAKDHINYINSTSEEQIQKNFARYSGEYSNRSDWVDKFWVDNGLLYFKWPSHGRKILRPISDTKFINLSRYN